MLSGLNAIVRLLRVPPRPSVPLRALAQEGGAAAPSDGGNGFASGWRRRRDKGKTCVSACLCACVRCPCMAYWLGGWLLIIRSWGRVLCSTHRVSVCRVPPFLGVAGKPGRPQGNPKSRCGACLKTAPSGDRREGRPNRVAAPKQSRLCFVSAPPMVVRIVTSCVGCIGPKSQDCMCGVHARACVSTSPNKIASATLETSGTTPQARPWCQDNANA